MLVTVKACCTVRPMEATWCGRVALSEWDQTGKVTHVPMIYFYRLPQNFLSQDNIIASTLKDSLSRVLVPFYPLAGRLHWTNNGRLELDCNATGVRFIEAESSSTLEDLTDFSASSKYHHLVPTVDYYSLPIHELPLALVQLTKFKCGGICIGVTLSHVVIDGPSAMHFTCEWARLARGQTLHTVPFLDRKVLRAGEPPLVPLTKCHVHTEFDDPPLLLGRTDNNEEKKKETRMNQEDLRRFHQDLHPEGREKEPFYGNPNLSVVSWLRLPLYDTDFGWGKGVYTSPATHDFDGDFVLLPDPDEDGSVLVCLDENEKPPISASLVTEKLLELAPKGESGGVGNGEGEEARDLGDSAFVDGIDPFRRNKGFSCDVLQEALAAATTILPTLAPSTETLPSQYDILTNRLGLRYQYTPFMTYRCDDEPPKLL
ncbi:hypothetical protein ACSQ67_006597 [Phaseolus vulgaris]